MSLGQTAEKSGAYVCFDCRSVQHLEKGDIYRGCENCKAVFSRVIIIEKEGE